MKPILYRVETYIVPEVNRAPGFSLEDAINEIDELKGRSRSKDREDEDVSENTTQSRKNTSSASHNKFIESKIYSVEQQQINIDDSKLIKRLTDITNKDETTSDRQFDNNNYKYNNENSNEQAYYVQKEFQPLLGSQDTLYPVRQFKKINSLMSIDESSEISLECKMNDFCHHGFKNGCTAKIPSPEVISDEIFKENWLQKMEILRQRDALLKEKEMNLQRRERELFKREKELRITERILNDKLKLVDQQLKYQKDIQLVEKKLEKAARILSDEVKKAEEPVKAEKLRDDQPPEKTLALVPEKIINPYEKNEETDKKIKYPIHPKNYSSKPSSPPNTFSRTHSYASVRYRERLPRNKIRFDDLNSTLSADNGDSSFVQTSKLFNPLLYKKPYVFTRSASERWPNKTSNASVTRPQGIVNVEEKAEPTIEEEKVFRKFSENIIASHDKDTKFQHYGLVDCKLNNVQSIAKPCPNPANEKKMFSYLDLATSNKQGQKRTNVSKDRPISWNEEEDEWLQKKRQAYNLAKNSTENKENTKCNIAAEKSGKSSKKDVKNKLFTIFR